VRSRLPSFSFCCRISLSVAVQGASVMELGLFDAGKEIQRLYLMKSARCARRVDKMPEWPGRVPG
jgi:hypothetical protein